MSRNRQRRAAERLVSSYNLPIELALQVTREQIELAEAIRQHRISNQIEYLVTEHGLHRSLAVQIVRGELDEAETLNKVYGKRMLKENASNSIWATALESEAELILFCHEQERKQAKILTVSQYAVDLSVGGECPKLNIKAAHLSSDPIIFEQCESASCPPIDRPEKRHRISNSRLFGMHNAGHQLEIGLLEGLIFRGTLAWFNQWELGITTEHGALSIFRHALTHIKQENQ